MVLLAERRAAAAGPAYRSQALHLHIVRCTVCISCQVGQAVVLPAESLAPQLIQRTGQALHLHIVKCISCHAGQAVVLQAERNAAEADLSYGSCSSPAHSNVYVSAAR